SDGGKTGHFADHPESVFDVVNHIGLGLRNFHSARSAITGSTRDARRAGSQQAMKAAPPSTRAVKTHETTVGAGMADHWLRTTRTRPEVIIPPVAKPIAINVAP